MPSAYPLDSDILALLNNMGTILPVGFVTTGYAAMASNDWERRTGYVPFLGSGIDSTRLYDPPGPNRSTTYGARLIGGSTQLDLGGGLYAITSINLGVTLSTPAGTLLLVQGQDYWMEPATAAPQNQPWERVQFRVQLFGPRQSIQVIGRFGWGATIPQDAWEAVRRLGCALALDDIAAGLRSRGTDWKEGTASESLNVGALMKLSDAHRSFAERTLQSYKRAGW